MRELQKTPITLFNCASSMIEYPVKGNAINQLIKEINTIGTFNYRCEENANEIEMDSCLTHDEFINSYWCAVTDPDGYENDVIIVSIDDVKFASEDENLYKQYRSK